jgi:hypothetical protein
MKQLLVLFFLGLNAFAYGQTQDCQSLHEGKFKVVTKESGTTIVTRRGNLQIEENADLGIKMTFDITWTNDCTYELRPKKVMKGDPSLLGKKGDFITVHIRNIKEKSYIALTTSNFFDVTLEFQVEVLE